VIPVAAMQVTDQGLSWPASPGRAAPGRRPWLHSRRAGDLAHHERGHAAHHVRHAQPPPSRHL